MRYHIKCPKAREIVLNRIIARRRANAMARNLGFRNYAEMCGDEC